MSMNKEEIMNRIMAAKKRKQEYVAAEINRLKKEYKLRTGLDANFVEVW